MKQKLIFSCENKWPFLGKETGRFHDGENSGRTNHKYMSSIIHCEAERVKLVCLSHLKTKGHIRSIFKLSVKLRLLPLL